MDYCNEQFVNEIWSRVSTDGIEEVKETFSSWSIISLSLCSLSILITILSLKYSSSSSQRRHFERSSRSLYLIINLLITNCLASIICGFGILFIKFLPIHLDIIVGDCLLLVLEIFQISSLLASGIHHLFLATNQRNAIKNLSIKSSLSSINSSAHVNHIQSDWNQIKGPDPYFVSILSWILPAFFFSGYFWIIPCQGFRSPECDFTFFLSFGYRVIIIVSFILLSFPILLIYLFILSECTIISRYIKWINVSRCIKSMRHQDGDTKTGAKNMLVIEEGDKCIITRGYDPKYYNSSSFMCPVNSLGAEGTKVGVLGTKAGVSGSTKNELSVPPDEVKVKGEQRAAEIKWARMTLFFFVTYLIAWMPRIVWMILSCVDGCPFPLFEQTLKLRSLIGMITENLIIIKSIIDPLLFAWKR